MTEPSPVLWLMGPTAAGKTTLANALSEHLKTRLDVPVVHWDGDQIRDLLGEDLGFSSDSRLRVVRGLVTLASATSRAGVLTIVSALTAHENARRLVRDQLPRLFVVHVTCPIETCIDRDPKGLYRKAEAGEIETLIGYNSEYVAPENPDLELDTSSDSVEGCVERLVDFLRKHEILPRGQVD